jgi:hypothetical protein
VGKQFQQTGAVHPKRMRIGRNDLAIAEKRYFSAGDEAAFFGWLQSIACVDAVTGHPEFLHVRLRRKPNRAELQELIGLLYRYRLDMTSLARFRSARNANWFDVPTTYWHARVFGKSERDKRSVSAPHRRRRS